jgi:hypothetical protein
LKIEDVELSVFSLKVFLAAWILPWTPSHSPQELCILVMEFILWNLFSLSISSEVGVMMVEVPCILS